MGIFDFLKQKEEVVELEVYDKSLQRYINDLVKDIQTACADGTITKKKEQSIIMSRHHALRRAIKVLEEAKK